MSFSESTPMHVRAGHISGSKLIPRRTRGQTAVISGWLFLFGAAGITYMWALANNTWIFISIFVSSLFALVLLGTCWEWLFTRRSLLNARNTILVGVLFW